MNYKDLKKDIFKDVIEDNFRVLNSIEKLLETKGYKDYENFNELAKQLSYDYLVQKRRDVTNEDLLVEKRGKKYECKNPADFPEENSPLDKINLIDPLTAWTEDRDELECGNLKFNYLKNLDAEIMILCKDSTGKDTYKDCVEKLQPYPENLNNYINKVNDINPFDFDKNDPNKKYLNALDWRYGFSSDVKNNRILRNMIHDYLDESVSYTDNGNVDPKENKNIFMTNSFVFLSASQKTSSIVPNSLFEMSVKEYIVPLLDIIKPRCVIQGGEDAIYFSINAIYNLIKDKDNEELQTINKDYEYKYKKHKGNFSNMTNLLKITHKNMLEKNDSKEFLYDINWDNEKTTLFFPSFHPCMPKYYKKEDGSNDGHYVWKYIKDYI